MKQAKNRLCISYLLLYLNLFGAAGQTFDTAFTALLRIDCCGWTGSDGTISVPLNNGKTIWLMGDSFIGTVNADTSRPCQSPLVNNTILLQDGNTFTTFYDQSDTSAYLVASDSTLLWPGHGFQENDTIYLFYYELKKSGLQLLNIKLVKLRESDLAITGMSNLPPLNGIFFGRYIYQEDGYRYIFGNRTEGLSRRAYLARIDGSLPIDNYGAWAFFNGSGWSSDVNAAASIIAPGQSSVSSYYSVLKIASKYYLISQNYFLGSEIYKWEADQVSGPYTNRTTIYDTAPFREYAGCDLFTYNAMIHPQFNTAQGLLVSFNVMPNRSDTSCSVSYCGIACCPPCGFCLHPLNFKNADTYRPKFFRIPLSQLNPACVEPPPAGLVRAAVRVFLQGPYVAAAQRMHDSLRVRNLIPLVEPYSALSGFTHVGGGGDEQTTPAVLAVSGPDAIVDWVFLELRAAAHPALVLATRSALVQRDGDVVDVDGVSDVTFGIAAGPAYFITVRHRNHLGVQTGAAAGYPVCETRATDFRSLPPEGFYAYNGLNPAQRLISGVYALWAGNGRIDDQLKYNGSVNDRNAILSVVGLATPNAIVPGYLPADYNLDGVVKYNGSANDRNVLLGNVGVATPSAVVYDQTAQ